LYLVELQGPTQTEEMLIARALPIIRVYIINQAGKWGGIQGIALIFLEQHVEELASVFPRHPSVYYYSQAKG
jgi:hypothetical protein